MSSKYVVYFGMFLTIVKQLHNTCFSHTFLEISFSESCFLSAACHLFRKDHRFMFGLQTNFLFSASLFRFYSRFGGGSLHPADSSKTLLTTHAKWENQNAKLNLTWPDNLKDHAGTRSQLQAALGHLYCSGAAANAALRTQEKRWRVAVHWTY